MRDERDLRIHALKKSKLLVGRRLARKLEQCSKFNPCESAACPMCSHQFRKWSFAEISHLSRQYNDILMMTVLCYSKMVTDRELFTLNFTKLIRTLARRFERSGFTQSVIGYVEFDYHTESCLWLPHFHLIVFGDEPATEEFRARYAHIEKRRITSASTDRFLHVSPLRHKGRQLSYLCKTFCSRIEAYKDSKGNRRTKKYRLHSSQLRLSLIVLDRLGMSGRLFLFRTRRVGNELRPLAGLPVNDEINQN